MQLTDTQFNAIEHLLPTPRGNVKIHNRTVIDACLHMLTEGCTWRRATTSSTSRTYHSGIWNKPPSHFVTVVLTQPK